MKTGKDMDGDDDGFVVKLRGLPWSATLDEVFKFFKNCNIRNGMAGIHMISSKEGRASGEAFVELEDEDNVHKACQKDREHIGNRYIEVFKVNKAEMEYVIKRCKQVNVAFKQDGCVRLRGLPFGCSKEEIAQFFNGLEIIPNGVTLLTDFSGRSSGEAYVQFVNKELAECALLKHRDKIGHRYIEIFRSSLNELSDILGHPDQRVGGGGGGGYGGGGYRPGPYDRGDRYGNGGGLGGGGGRDGGRFPRNNNSRNFKGGFSNNSGGGGGGGRNWSNSNSYSSRNNDSWGGGRNHSGPMGGGGGGNIHCVHMRGLPFKATQMDISDFFKPLVPVHIRLLQEHSGRASGEADVEFASHDEAVRAMSHDKDTMQHRYIELFLNSSSSSSSSSGAGGGGGGGGNSYSSGGSSNYHHHSSNGGHYSHSRRR